MKAMATVEGSNLNINSVFKGIILLLSNWMRKDIDMKCLTTSVLFSHDMTAAVCMFTWIQDAKNV